MRKEFIGRVVTRRAYGRRGFAILESSESDRTRQQVFVHRQTCGDEAYQRYMESAVGSKVRVEGALFISRQNIPTIRTQVWEILQAPTELTACFFGQLVERRRYGKQQYAFLEASDGRRQQIAVNTFGMSEEGFDAFRKCDFGTTMLAEGSLYVSNVEGIPTILVSDLTIMGDYHGQDNRSNARRYRGYSE